MSRRGRLLRGDRLGFGVGQIVNYALQSFWWLLAFDLGMNGVFRACIGRTGLLRFMGDLAGHFGFKDTPADGRFHGGLRFGTAGTGFALAHFQLKVDGAVFDTDDRVRDRRQQRNAHLAGHAAFVHALFVYHGFVVVELDRDGFAVFNADREQEVGIGLAA